MRRWITAVLLATTVATLHAETCFYIQDGDNLLYRSPVAPIDISSPPDSQALRQLRTIGLQLIINEQPPSVCRNYVKPDYPKLQALPLQVDLVAMTAELVKGADGAYIDSHQEFREMGWTAGVPGGGADYGGGRKTVHVRDYHRRDGTYVREHYRSPPSR